jgi:predicted lipoprotein with Yx(FWY)xxD motif
MRKRGWAAIALGPLVLLVAACGSSSTTPGSAYGNSSATPTASGSAGSSGSTTGMGTSSTSGGMSKTVTLTIKDSKIGNVLADAKGQTIYWYSKDMKGGPSTCTGSCLSAWPLVTGTPVASMGVKFAGKLGSVKDADGVVQATYNGYPLYTYTGDMAPGDTSGNGAGGVWHVISGQDLTASTSSGSGSMSGSSGSGSSGSGYGSGYSYEASQTSGSSSLSSTAGTSGGKGSSASGTGSSSGGTGSTVSNAPKSAPASAPAPGPTSSPVNGGGCGEGSCW